MAAIVSEAEPAVRKALDEYATYMGLTFQITDDILDVVGDEALLGKPVGSDLKNDKATYVTIFSLEEARQMARDAADKALWPLSLRGQGLVLEGTRRTPADPGPLMIGEVRAYAA